MTNHLIPDTPDVTEHALALAGVPGVLWTPASASAEAPAPLLLLGHPGGLDAIRQRLAARARQAAAAGFASAAIELPGSGSRPRLPHVDAARADLQRAVRAGEPLTDDVVDRLVLPLVELAVPEWRSALDELLARPEIGEAAAYSGGVLAIGVRLALVEPRIAAVVLFAGSAIPKATYVDARRLTKPVLALLQWDDENNERQAALNLFDTIGSSEKTLHANTGGHTGTPAFEGVDVNHFLLRHLA
ncbi:hypothetical protein SAMN06264364_1631 [Quadrisphaera granulorum]|uniref:Dienelactone hydrolase n=1 Tax=Quadrisphaera granulorum TaxID=317664 RepID=A0A315ZE94_9ACTN|nr:alpha/beta hydrolase [Quadrisphaera granulorum]PWJ43652.1 hypothetical protein BXY45_1631 [Quadrisphaera granulorum]SZE99208.1 hypothetical protein SAMN06264364_1631 [Quadrisphaera granulorum]